MMTTCQLCTADPRLIWNKPLFESPNFVVLPSLGALVEGWLLLLPKEHFLSFGTLPDRLVSEMQELKQEVITRLDKLYGPVSVFEHGPCAEGRSVGCGVDHAHMHLVPIEWDLRQAVAPFLPSEVSWLSADLETCRDAIRNESDYLYLEQPVGKGHLVFGQNLGSQVFRRAIATHIGVPEEFNWRNDPQVENIEKTIATIREDLLSNPKYMQVSEYAA